MIFLPGENQEGMMTRAEDPGGHWLPGVRAVLELLRLSPERADMVYIQRGRRDARSAEILNLCRACGVRFRLSSPEELGRLYAVRCQGVLARVFDAGFSGLEEALPAARNAPLPLILALDQVLDPGNAGTLARTLCALGGGGLLIPKHQAAYLGAGAARSAAGALEKLPVVKAANLGRALDLLRDEGFSIYGAVSSMPDTRSVYDLRPVFPAVLALGGEEKGLRPGILRRCAELVHIPMPGGFDSLNVAQAGAILLAFFSAARRDGGA